jgi:hypothetical protein
MDYLSFGIGCLVSLLLIAFVIIFAKPLVCGKEKACPNCPDCPKAEIPSCPACPACPAQPACPVPVCPKPDIPACPAPVCPKPDIPACPAPVCPKPDIPACPACPPPPACPATAYPGLIILKSGRKLFNINETTPNSTNSLKDSNGNILFLTNTGDLQVRNANGDILFSLFIYDPTLPAKAAVMGGPFIFKMASGNNGVLLGKGAVPAPNGFNFDDHYLNLDGTAYTGTDPVIWNKGGGADALVVRINNSTNAGITGSIGFYYFDNTQQQYVYNSSMNRFLTTF